MSIREIHTLDTQIYAPAGDGIHLKLVGMMKAEETFKALKYHLESVGLLPDEYFSGGLYDKKQELPKYYEAICNTNWGGSEGIYIDISLLYREDDMGELKFFKLATGKTLGQSGDDFILMSRIAAECSMMLNGFGAVVKVTETKQERERRIESCVNMVCNYRDFSDEQKAIIRSGLVQNLSVEDVKTYAYPKLTTEEMENMLSDLIKEKGNQSLAAKVEGAVVRSLESDKGEKQKIEFLKE